MVAPSETAEAIVAALIGAMGLVALALGAARWKSGDRSAVWFAVFAGLYGLRLAGQSQLFQPALPEIVWRYLGAFVTYIIVAPLALFLESLFGAGWRSSVRRIWQAILVYAPLALILDLVRGRPGETARWLNGPVVLVAGLAVVGHVVAFWRRDSWSAEFRLAAMGGLVFMGVATYQTFWGSLPLEPFAMLLFMTSVGYLVTRRMLLSERTLVAMSRELELARKIQQSILPRSFPDVPGLKVAACYLPMSQIGGDFYDFDTHHPGRLGLIVADVSGHGVPAALVASMVKIAFAAETERIDRPALALANINRTLCDRFEGAYVTAGCAFIDPVGLTLNCSNAGHPKPLLRRRDGRVEVVGEHGLLLAFDPLARYVDSEVPLQPGDRVVFYSDGLIEAANARDEFFGDARFGQVLAASSSAAPQEFIEELLRELRAWTGPDAELQDDVTVVVVDVARKSPRAVC